MLLWRSSLLLEYSNRFIIFLWVLFYSSYIHIIHSRVRVEFLHIFPFVCSFPKLKTIQWTIKEGVAVIWKEAVSGYISFVWTSRNKITFCSLLYLIWCYSFFCILDIRILLDSINSITLQINWYHSLVDNKNR